MLISKTPYRISFAGGGSDLPSHYLINGGCVVSTSIDKYIYITLNKSFYPEYTVVKYSEVEKTDNIKRISHPIIRESLLKYSVSGVEINSTSDIPAGTGMGSSSSFTVGLLNLIRSYLNLETTKEQLADEACDMEINILNEPVGKQDQYAASFGGLNYIEFKQNGNVLVDPIKLNNEEIEQMSNNMLLFYLGNTRNASSILKQYNTNDKNQSNKKNQLANLAKKLRDELNSGNIDSVGKILDENWKIKRTLSEGVTSQYIDEIYDKAMDAGAIGGKLLGAGGSGFLLVYADSKDHDSLRRELKLKELPFRMETNGSQIVYNDNYNKG